MDGAAAAVLVWADHPTYDPEDVKSALVDRAASDTIEVTCSAGTPYSDTGKFLDIAAAVP